MSNLFAARTIRLAAALVLCAVSAPAEENANADGQIGNWKFQRGTSGWTSNNQAAISSRDELLQVRCSGNDPMLFRAVEGPAGWKTLNIRWRVPQTVNAQLFWTEEAAPGTSEAHSVRFQVKSRGSQWVDTVTYFHTDSPLKSLRLDPHSSPVELSIESISLRSSGPPPADPATDPSAFVVADGFSVELLYSVPKAEQGSWVSATFDDHGRLIVCDQYGGLYRVTPPPIGQSSAPVVEKIPVDVGEAQGLLYAFDCLYVVVNRGRKYASGLYRVRDTNGDDAFDRVETLQLFEGGGEHGPHAVRVGPDDKSLYVVAGNNTQLPSDIRRYRLPQNWAEDQLLPRAPCSNGHNTGVLAPGGWVGRCDPDGGNWELVAAGFRNPYDIAFNQHGELFTFDADMEMDVGTPWYRPTRVCHVVSGAEFGWRFGTGKWPHYAVDSLPPVVDVGQGSPTGVSFAYEAKYPRKYRDALYICDWTHGRLYAVHLSAKGATYGGRLETFIAGSPLPLTDIAVSPVDGAMYFTIGGRQTQSGLYRVTYTGKPARRDDDRVDTAAQEARRIRRRLERFHGAENTKAVDEAWPLLSHSDRFIRYAARIAIEHQPVDGWKSRAIDETETDAAIQSLLALSRSAESDVLPIVLRSLVSVYSSDLTTRQKLDWLRTLSVACSRHGRPTEDQTRELVRLLSGELPSKSRDLNHELVGVLVYLEAEVAVRRGVALMSSARTQEDLLAYAMPLRVAERGWNANSRSDYFAGLNRAEGAAGVGDFIGGGHFQIYVRRMREDAIGLLDEGTRTRLDSILNAEVPSAVPTGSPTPRKFVRNWKMEAILPHLDKVGEGRSFEAGKQLYVAASCAHCHRFNNVGGVLGPDITAAVKRYSRPVLLREILDPSKQISDQFQTHVLVTDSGKVIEGRILNRNESTIRVAVDPRKPVGILELSADEVEEIVPSKASLMPNDLLNTLSLDEILDLLAYIESAGDPQHANFKQP